MKSHLISRKLFVSASFLLVLFLLLSTASFAWLVFINSEIDISEIGGQLLTNYFHSGKGTEDDPFIITRPIHYYNLVNLYQRVSDYSDNEYYFQIGTKLKSGDDSYYVYNYDDDGNLIEGSPYSQELNLAYYNGENALLPIGTHDKNFLGHFNGNGLTVSNFTVSTLEDQKDCDIGIFGFVGENGDIHDVYFSNITIDLSNVSSTAEVINAASERQTHNSGAHTVNGHTLAYVGYIAGHIITNSQFTDVYINNMSIAGGGSGTAATSGFGYFGCVEDENTDGVLVDSLIESFPVMTDGGVGMDEIYERLTSRRANAETVSFTKSKSVWVNGETTEEFDEISTSVIRKNDSNSSVESFSFSKDSAESDGNTVYLTGKSDMTQTVTTYTVTDNDGFYLASQSGNTYLKLNEEKDGITTTQIAADATVWGCNGDGYYFTTEINNTTHSCNYYYITAVEGEAGYNAEITTTPTTRWTYSDNKMYCTAGGSTWYLAFSGEGLGSAGGSTKPIIQSEYGGTTYYIKVNGNTIGTTTDESQATEFEKDTDGYWKVKGGTNSQYLNYLDSNVQIGNTQMTWVYVNNNWMTSNKVIYYNGTSWKIKTSDISEINVFINRSNTNYFLNASTSAFSAPNTSGTTSQIIVPDGGASVWVIEPTGTGSYKRIYTVIDNTRYYLCGNKINTNWGSLSLNISASAASQWIAGVSTSYWYTSINGTNYYLAFDGSEWCLCNKYTGSVGGKTVTGNIKKTYPLNGGDGDGENGNLTNTAGNIYKQTNVSSVYYTVDQETDTSTLQYPTTDTYFPILAGVDGAPTDENFGYVVSGMQYKQNDLYRSGDIWVTQSAISNISASYSGGTFSNIKTVNASGTVEAESVTAFSGYSSAKSGFDSLLSGKTNINGLHFMASSVSASDTVTLTSATVCGIEHTDYILPRHCIDVTLQKDGCISIFAGNYYSGNTGFFSLYHVIRDGTGTISEVKKISKIYKQGSMINYVYSGESTVYEGDIVFDSAWMTNSISLGNSLFYFEIPVMAGEYAIGAEDGNNGAYLLYLSAAETELVLGDENSLTENNFKVDVRSAGYKESANYTDHSLLQFAVNVPGVSSEDFSVDISFTDDDLPDEYNKGLYTISVVNQTGTPIEITVYLCDDDGISDNEYLYAYKIVYSNATTANQTVMNGAKNYFQGCAQLTIP